MLHLIVIVITIMQVISKILSVFIINMSSLNVIKLVLTIFKINSYTHFYYFVVTQKYYDIRILY